MVNDEFPRLSRWNNYAMTYDYDLICIGSGPGG